MLLHLRFPAGIRVKFKAGQHLNLILSNGERRDFSMANPPSESDGAQLHVRHVPGGAFTTYVFERLKQGDMLKAELPFGDFTLRQSTRPVLFIAGSTGFAPIQSMVEDAMSISLTRDMIFYWGARQRAGLYSDLPQKWAKNNPRFKYVPVLSEMTEPGIRHGLVHRAVLEDLSSLEHFDVYACGVPAMTQAAEAEFVAAGLPREHFYADSFVTRADVAAAGP
jgi:NAD(P)H-flavin reductase